MLKAVVARVLLGHCCCVLVVSRTILGSLDNRERDADVKC